MKVYFEGLLKAGDCLKLDISLQFDKDVVVDERELEIVAYNAIRNFLLKQRSDEGYVQSFDPDC